MNYKLETETKGSLASAGRSINKYMKGQWFKVSLSILSVLVNSIAAVSTPIILGDTLDRFIKTQDSSGLGGRILLVLGIYIITFLTEYLQIFIMGRVGQIVIFKLRDDIFKKLQELPIAFFNQNKSGDLIARINGDTEKLSQVFSETLLRLVGSIFILIGIAIAMLVMNFKLGLIALLSFIGLLIFSRLISPLLQRVNKASLDKTGDLSAEIQESLSNFKVVVAFNKRDFFRSNFKQYNDSNFQYAVKSSIINGILQPLYDFAGSIAQALVVVIGIIMIINGEITLGVLLSYIILSAQFYQPLRIFASLLASIQGAVAAWQRIYEVLSKKNNLLVDGSTSLTMTKQADNILLAFDKVSFGYDENLILKDVDFELEKGKTYALVGPTGGGKSTTAALMARLYDPTAGQVSLYGKNIRSYEREELAEKIGFILQEPFLFTGTISENLVYGNTNLTIEKLESEIKNLKLEKILERFKDGLETKIENGGENISLGQKQIIAFMRAILRRPKFLILDEATANIDTVTENLLEEIIDATDTETTKVIIAHRLNTIKKADEIFFITNGTFTKAGSFEKAIEMIDQVKRNS